MVCRLQAHGNIIWENFLDHKNVLGQTKLLYGHCFYEKLPNCPHRICGYTAPELRSTISQNYPIIQRQKFFDNVVDTWLLGRISGQFIRNETFPQPFKCFRIKQNAKSQRILCWKASNSTVSRSLRSNFPSQSLFVLYFCIIFRYCAAVNITGCFKWDDNGGIVRITRIAKKSFQLL